jgi:protein SCO1/2
MNAQSRFLRVVLLSAITSMSASGGESPRQDGFDYEVPSPGSYVLPVIRPAADGDVLNTAGEPMKLSEVSLGRATVLSFIYSRCGDARSCPHATGVLKQLHIASAADPMLGTGMRLVSMSFDPTGDTPERMSEYAAIAQGEKQAADWLFLTTASAERLQPILTGFGQAVDRKANPNDPLGPLNHTLRVFLIDHSGRIRNIYSAGTLDSRLVLADVRTLLLERAQSNGKPLTPAEAARRNGEIAEVSFKVETAARVTDITDRENHRPHGVDLVDTRNDSERATPTERAGITVNIPATALASFKAKNLDELAKRYEGRTITVTGRIVTEPHPFRHDSQGNNELRPKITVVDPAYIRIAQQ